ncbi:MAG: Ldh family oxidoreductase [Rhodoferax sp.]|nr:Ldh family oxidoreductase [Rhodoferax sp.]MCB9122891.1 Ldh family oxidoreductase [Caldilineaceae bacterium]
MTEISTHDLIDVIEEVLGRFLVASDSPRVREPDQSDVQRAALWFVQAELLKLPAFGIQMLLRDLGRLDAMHEAVPASTPAVSPLAIDAARFPGHVALACAVRLAAQAVRSQGAAIVGIRNVGALGVLGCAARSLAAEGAVAVVSANSMAFVAPWGGAAAAIGTNPMAVAAPRANAAPFVIDFSTSPLTLAALRHAQASGGALPASGAVDRTGQRTDDPTQAAALLPEGRIGSLTGLAMELITGVGVGGRLPAGAPAQERSALVIAYAPAAMGNHDAAELCEQLVRDWHGAGGHVPSRFDALALHREQLPAAVSINRETLAALRARR